ncbi:MAG: IPTL-CTERM sorting domain-containing protein [Candidatus Zixiibacteriota bacterium]|nr:MAG: IPTL-CTERM sorting domain-containing protein [candidate division Zixibacteria bacterium]
MPANKLKPIPTRSEWSMLIMGLLLLAAGAVAVIRRRGSVLHGNS